MNITNLSLSAPTARGCYGSAYDAADQEVVLFGGCGAPNGIRLGLEGDTWTFAHGVWARVTGPSPPARTFPSMAYDAADGYVVMFGGDSSGVAFNDTWAFAGGTWRELATPVHPGARTEAMMTYDAADGYILLFGGYNTTTFGDEGDTWEFSGGAWTSVAPLNGTRPVPRHSASIAYDPADDEVLLFGGFRESLLVAANDTWTYRAGLWTKLSPPGTVPAPREQAAMGFDPPTNQTLLFGGDSVISVLGDLWGFGNGRWTRVPWASHPSGRTESAIIPDPVDGYDLLFGGNSSVPNGPIRPLPDSWSLGPNLTSSLEAYRPVIDVGQSVTYYARAVANGSPTFSYRYASLPPGCTTSDLPAVTCAPSRVGLFTPNVTVTANWGSSSNTTYAATNLSVNPLPSISSLTVAPAALDYNERFTVRFTTSGGTGVDRYSYSGTPSNCPSVNTTVLNCTVNGGPIAGGYPHVFQVNATVTDALGGRNTSSVNVTVNADPGVGAGTFAADPRSTDVGILTDLVSNASGGTGPLTYAYAGLPPGCRSANLSVLPCRPTSNGTYTVQLTVTDSRGYASSPASATLTVDPLPQIGQFSLTPGQLDVGQQLSGATSVVGGTGTVTYSYAGMPAGCPAETEPSFTCAPSVPGNYTVRVTATDSVGGQAAMTTQVTVRADPTIESFGSGTPHVDWNQTIHLSALATGGSGPLSYSYSGLPTGCPGTNASSVACPTTSSTAPGSYTVRLRVADRAGFIASATARVEVSSDPLIRSFTVEPSTVSVGDSAGFGVVISGGSGGPRLLYSGLPPGCQTNDSPALSCTPAAPGEFNVSVAVTDLANYTVTDSVRLTVGPRSSVTDSSGSGPALDLGLGVGAAIGGVAVILAWVRHTRRRPGEPPVGPETSEETLEPLGPET